MAVWWLISSPSVYHFEINTIPSDFFSPSKTYTMGSSKTGFMCRFQVEMNGTTWLGVHPNPVNTMSFDPANKTGTINSQTGQLRYYAGGIAMYPSSDLSDYYYIYDVNSPPVYPEGNIPADFFSTSKRYAVHFSNPIHTETITGFSFVPDPNNPNVWTGDDFRIDVVNKTAQYRGVNVPMSFSNNQIEATTSIGYFGIFDQNSPPVWYRT
jgi:hypothetical protein